MKGEVIVLRKYILLTVGLMLLAVFHPLSTEAMMNYQTTTFQAASVTAQKLNIRKGPDIKYAPVCTVQKGHILRVFAKIGKWYVVQTPDDFVGMAHENYLKPVTAASQPKLSTEEQEIFDLVNKTRADAKLKGLKVDENLLKSARAKAQDMASREYFSHESPVYGTLVDMLKEFKVSYKTTGENISGNAAPANAFKGWMDSLGHKKNILNSAFNYTGIGTAESSKYGKIVVQQFIGK